MRLTRLTLEEGRRLGGPAGTAAHLRALTALPTSVEERVREILEAVRTRGEEAVLEYTRALDTAGNAPLPLLVTQQELDDAITSLPLDVVAGLQVTIANVAEVAQAGADRDVSLELPQGQRVALRDLPVASAAVYVPGGRAPYPSTVVMGVVTARAAGVLDVAVCSPPGADAQIHSSILGTCRLCGVERVYRMGGAQAIAALAYGTDSVAAVDVVVGPGNIYVQEAKRQLSAHVGVDGFAGPSELAVLLGPDAGEHAVRLAALDLLAQAEHGVGSLVVAVTTDPAHSDALLAVLEHELSAAPTAPGERAGPPGVDASEAEGAACAIVDASDPAEAIAIANALAPEHLQLIGAEIETLAWSVRSAGCLLIGAGSATAFTDYVVGSNHVLPTGGAARFASMLSARHFRRRRAEVRIGAEAAAKLAKAGAPIARTEGFEWHARSMEARMGDNYTP